MIQTVTRLYASYDDALRAALALKEAGFTDRELSLVARRDSLIDADVGPGAAAPGAAAEDAGTGASVGGVLGAAAGLMAGMGVLAIPGMGPVVAAGWLASTLAVGAAGAVAGGAVGGIVGALSAAGTPEPDARLYAEGVHRGDSLVTVRVADDRVLEATRILAEFRSVDPASRADEFRHEDPDHAGVAVPPYVSGRRDPVLPAGLPRTPPR